MHICRWVSLCALVFALAACAGGPPPTALPAPSPTTAPTLATPAPFAPTLLPQPTATPGAAGTRAVTLTTSDGAELQGTLYGSGPITVVLSNMGDNDPAPWQAFAPQLAARGYTVLTYSYRFAKNAGGFDNTRAQQTLEDLRAAIAFAQRAQPQQLVLVGASLGGMMTAKAAGAAQPSAVVILAAPAELPAFDVRVEPAELQALTMPKLVIGSQQDGVVPFADTQRLYALAPEPKELHSYPGSAHGVQLLDGAEAGDLADRLIEFIAAHTSAAGSPAPALAASAAEQSAWREDLRYLAEQLRARHPKPFYRTSAAAFEQAVQQLDAALPTLTRDQFVVGLIQIAALIDGHTQLPIWQPGLGFHLYPLRLYWFRDGLFVIDAQPPYADTIGARVLRIGALDTAETARLLDPLAQHDNAMTTRQVAPMFYLMPEAQAARGVAVPGAPAFTLAYADGSEHAITPEPITIADYLAWTGGRLAGLPQRAEPLALSRIAEAFWLTSLQDGQVVYVQYNQVRRSNQAGETLSAFARRLADLLDQGTVRRVVLDMRHNGGGDNTTYGPLLRLLRDHALFQQPGALYVIVGRQTFSAATNFVTELERAGGATFVGEPTGGSPNLYGDTRSFRLPNSGLTVQISSRYWQMSTPDDSRDALAPQIAAELASQDFFGGSDPALAAALAAP